MEPVEPRTRRRRATPPRVGPAVASQATGGVAGSPPRGRPRRRVIARAGPPWPSRPRRCSRRPPRCGRVRGAVGLW